MCGCKWKKNNVHRSAKFLEVFHFLLVPLQKQKVNMLELKIGAILLLASIARACKTAEWRNMSMEELLLKSDIVVYGKDIDHGKFRIPTELDARFDVYCVFKTAEYNVPGQVIIENINEGDFCSGVRGQTEVSKEYIVGFQRQFSGFVKYSNINPLQPTAFLATENNLEKVIAVCGLDNWNPPHTGAQDLCPAPNKPRFCTKVRDPTNRLSKLSTNLYIFLLSLGIYKLILVKL